jgi:cobalamin-dependent methionine synthase I
LKIAPEYEGTVVWMKYSSQNAIVASRLLNSEDASIIATELKGEYEQLRNNTHKQEILHVSLDEARENGLKLF